MALSPDSTPDLAVANLPQVILTLSPQNLTPPPTGLLNHHQNHDSHSGPNILSPTSFKYYNDHLNKYQFNLILTNTAVSLLKVIYPTFSTEPELRFFIVEILRRSRTSIQSLQLACFYIVKLIQGGRKLPLSLCKSPKFLFLGLIILASKFNQDYNFSFKSWLKICGVSDSDNGGFTVQTLRTIERDCLQLLDYNCFIDQHLYNNWCNFLAILGYDLVVKQHDLYANDLQFSDMQSTLFGVKLNLWKTYLIKNLQLDTLKYTQIKFTDYYNSILNTKVVSVGEVKSLFNKKHNIDDMDSSLQKKVKV
ncbi:uncharacterized protein KQ657_004823 [Scheffersomyces spartinae]|uniref:Cyclin N-terminal domain-containing protein n=1 Tax=Scheffersomyces spartinae TaxID=45513 RepID=A0A9P8AIW4_9ASCO|nr:uncharacterized protein KQ657_004823 [Scheffersomyces spartinae]KAG7194115.1 hypothetical protein KQ657_004823 [Scheffersomyces spartinae]